MDRFLYLPDDTANISYDVQADFQERGENAICF